MKTDHDEVSRGSTDGADPTPQTAKPASQTGEAADGSVKPAEAPPSNEPAEDSADKPAESVAADKPAEDSPDEPAESVAAEKPAEPVSAEEPAEPVSADKPAEDSADKPAESVAADKPGTDGSGEAGTGDGDAESVPAAEGRSGLLGRFLPPRTTKARVLVAAVALVTLGALVGLGWGGYWLFTRLPEGVAFQVKGVDVTEAQLDEQMQTLTALYGVQAPVNDPARMDAFRRDAAKSTAMAMTIDNAAAERKVVVADRQATDFLTRYVSATYGDGQAGRDAFIKDLADKGTSEPKVLAEIRRQLTNKQLFEQVTAGITVSDQEVRQTFDQRKEEFATPERREIHNIVVKTRPEADALLAELNAGANFEALAPQRSLDSATKDSGGNLGLVSARDLQKGYADAAFAAPVGTLIGPIETQQKAGPMYNVGKVVSTQPSVPADFEQIKEGVRRLLVNERANTRWREFMEEQIREADVEYADKYRPADPTGLPPVGNEAGAPAPPR